MSRMTKTSIAAIAASVMTLSLAAACTRAEAVENIPAGTEVTVVTEDGTLVRGKIAKVDAAVVTLTGERPNTSTEITRSSIAEVKRVEAATETAANPGCRGRPHHHHSGQHRARRHAQHALASDASRVEAPVRGTLASPVVIDGTTAIPSGATLSGHVTHVDDSDKVKGRAELSFRFTSLTTGPVSYDIDTRPLAFVAESTKKDDAVKIGVGRCCRRGDRRDHRRRQGRRHRFGAWARAPAPASCLPPTAKKFGLQKDASSKSRLPTR